MNAPSAAIERLTRPAQWPAVDALLREYVPWVMDGLAAHHGVRFDEAEVEMHNDAFATEAAAMLHGRGRLLLARLHGQPAGLVALKPVDAGVAEIKRLYVRPSARGHGIGRALLQRLLADARVEGFHTLQLETMSFMVQAHAMYETMGFVDSPPFKGSQASMSGLVGVVRFMTLVVPPAPPPVNAEVKVEPVLSMPI